MDSKKHRYRFWERITTLRGFVDLTGGPEFGQYANSPNALEWAKGLDLQNEDGLGGRIGIV